MSQDVPAVDQAPVIDVEDLQVLFRSRLRNGRQTVVRAVDGVNLHVLPGETLGLVGESGCGKSTVARTIAMLNIPSRGRVRVCGRDIAGLGRAGRKETRREIQMVFQDPSGSLNPRMTIGSLVTEPLILNHLPRRDRASRLADLLDSVGLPHSVATRYPHELSGGQLQRAAIARALAVDPSIVVADEPVSALDVSVQAQIINLLLDLQRDRKMSYLFISHDLAVVAQMSDRVAVMYLGEVVETATTDDLFEGARHPYTQSLLSAVTEPDPEDEQHRQQIILSGDMPSPSNPPTGCRFHTRCWLRQYVSDPARCAAERPALAPVGDDHAAACHFHEHLQPGPDRADLLRRAAAESASEMTG